MKLKKLLALMLALVMAVCVFAACDEKASNSKDDESTESTAGNKEENKEENKPVSDEDAIKEVAETFSKYLMKGDEKALDYVAEESRDKVKAELEEIKNAMDSMTGGIDSLSGAPEEVVVFLKGWVEDYKKAFEDSVEVKVSNIKINADKATADIETACLNTELEVDPTENLDKELLSRCSMEEFQTMSDAEKSALMVDVLKTVYTEMLETIKAAPKAVEKSEGNFKKVDGKWLVVVE